MRRRMMLRGLVVLGLIAGTLVLAAQPAAALPPKGGLFYPVAPARVLDTRVAAQGPCISGGESRFVTVGGRGGVPEDARSVVLNITVVSPTANGYLTAFPAGEVRPPHCHVVLHLAPRKGGARDEMWFVDPRTFGEVVVFDPTRADETVPELARLGPDPVLDDFDGSVLAERLRGRRAPIKQVLLDQHVVAGIGNIYADEVLHRARVRGDRPADRLSRRTVNRIADAVVEILNAAIDAGGSTLDDTQYVDVSGATGTYQHEHRVYGRGGEPCLTCGKGVIRRSMKGGRSSSWCPVCQPR